MKILSIGNFLNPSWDSSIPDEEHIAGALESLGHEVYRWQREDLVGDLNSIKGGFDFVLVAQWDGFPADLNHIIKRYTGAPIVYWAFDYQADGQEWHELLVNQTDLYLSKRIADSKYDNWQWLAQDFAPQFLDKYSPGVSVDDHLLPPRHKDIDVLFTGTYLDFAHERNDTLKAVDEKFNLVIHSVNPEAWKERGFKNVHGPVMDDGLPELYARAEVILSIDHTIEAGYWSDRNAQIMACGGHVLFRYVPLSETVFRDGITYFYNIEDCLNRLGNILEMHEEDKIDIIERGYEHAQSNLKVIHRVVDLITIVQGIL